MDRQTLLMRRKVMGEEHSKALNCVHGLVTVDCDHLKYDDTLLFFKRAYLEFEKVLGPEYPDTKISHRSSSYSSEAEEAE